MGIEMRIEEVHHISPLWDAYCEFLKKKIRRGEVVVLNRKRIFKIWLNEFLPQWAKERNIPAYIYENYKNLVMYKDVDRQLNYVVNILIKENYLERVGTGRYRNLWALQNGIFSMKNRGVSVKNANP